MAARFSLMRTDFNSVARAAAIAVAAGAAAALLALFVAAAAGGPIVLEMNGALPRRVASGLYPPEVAGDLTFAWTGPRADITLAGLDRRRRWSCDLRLRAARAAGAAAPRVDISIDGLPAATAADARDFVDVPVEIPPLAARSGARLSIASASTFVPGGGDSRALGVQLDRIACRPSEGRVVPPPQGQALRTAGAAATVGAAAALAGLAVLPAAMIAIVTGFLQTVPLSSGAAAYTGFAGLMLELAAGIGLVTALLLRVIEAVRRASFSSGTRTILFSIAAALYLQLLGLMHPSKNLVDAVFHAHRFTAVLAGGYFFTQPLPAGVSFPYAIALYIFAAPWARLTSDYVSLLRIVVCASDAFAFGALVWLMLATRGDRLAAAVVAGASLLLPITYEVIGNANLTNEFGYAVSIVTLVLAASWAPGAGRFGRGIAVALLCAVAFLSHVSTIALLAAALMVLAVLQWWRGGPWRMVGAGIMSATMLAGALSVAVYYGHFTDVYVKALRIRSQPAAASPAAAPDLAAPPVKGLQPVSLPGRVVNAVQITVGAFGWPIAVLAAAGAWRVRAERRIDPVAALAIACAGAFLIFNAVAAMRVDAPFQRYAAEFVARVALATSPGAVVLAGEGASWGLRGRWPYRVVTIALLVTMAVVGGDHWLAWFR